MADNEPRIPGTDAEWRSKLSPEEYRVLRKKGTEPAFSGEYLETKGDGVFRCRGCGNSLFSSSAKFDSGTGWPSFYEALSSENVRLEPDTSHGMNRTEVVCSHCGGHLGHVFDDGPQPTGKRFCINSLSLDFNEEPHSGD
ncbi:MAG: peptide-methionine (R)-S-oxide reductase MsrB [Terriglobia bacterium]